MRLECTPLRRQPVEHPCPWQNHGLAPSLLELIRHQGRAWAREHDLARAHEVAQLARPLVGGEPLPVHLVDGLRGWRLWHLGHAGRSAVVRMLQALEQSVERNGGRRDAGLALLGELHAAGDADVAVGGDGFLLAVDTLVLGKGWARPHGGASS